MKRFIALWFIIIAASWYPAQASRTFVSATTALTVSSAIVSPPFTVCAWFRSNSQTADQSIWSIGDSTAAGVYHGLRLIGSGTDVLVMSSRNTATRSASTTATYVAGTWHSGCGTVASGSTSRSAYLDGGNQGTDGNTEVPATLNTTTIGRRIEVTPSEYFRGELEHITVWNVQLTAAEIAAYASRIHPTRIRKTNIISYVPIWGVHSPEIDLMGSRSWTIVGSPAQATGAPVGLFTRP